MMKQGTLRNAVMINFFSKYLNIFVQLVFSAILARLLTPQDFGVVAVTTVFTSFFLIFANLGLGVGVIQDKTLNKSDLDHIFSFTIYLAIFLSVVFSGFSWFIARFYDNPVYIPIGILLSFSLFFSALNVVPNAILQKEKKFMVIGIRTIVVTAVTAVITIVLALIGLKYYAIVINSILVSGLTFAWNYHSTRLIFHWRTDLGCIKRIRSLSTYQFIFNFVNYFSRNLDNLLIGKLIGPSALAYYNQAYKLMQYPIANLTHVITPVLHPILSDYQDNRAYIYEQYIRIAKLLSLLGAFIAAFCFFNAREIILLFYGNQWESAIPVFRILALSVWAQMITSSSGAIFQSLGETRLLFFAGLINTILTVVAILIGVATKNITIVATCVTIAYNIHFMVAFYLLNRFGFNRPFSGFIKHFLPDFLIFGLVFLSQYLVNPYMDHALIFNLLLKMSVAVIVYGFALLITRQWTTLFSFFRKN